ncbi:hypothetical protein BDP27DRAFT_1347946, partial [Rhodocollybia butyracea]
MMLPEPDEIEEELTPQDALENISLAISALIVPMSSTVRCVVPLSAVKKIRTDLRAKTNKQLPMEPHPWVSSILRPVKVFFGITGSDGVGVALKNDYLDLWAIKYLRTYISHVSTLKKAEESLRRLKRGTKSTGFSFRDEEPLGKDATTLGIRPENNHAFEFVALSNLVQTND